MKTEIKFNRKVICDHVFPIEEIHVNQSWLEVNDGRVATIVGINENTVEFRYLPVATIYKKNWYTFQTKHCLLVDIPNIQ